MKKQSLIISGIKNYYLIFFSAIAFIIPFVFSGPQIITGTIVNCLLFLSSFSFQKKEMWPVLALPSIAALLHGAVFGPFTSFLIFFIPIIWLSNFLLIYSFSFFRINLPLAFSLLLSALIKTFLLYSFATIYFKFSLVPKIFITSMGLLQFETAIMGGILALGIHAIIENERKESTS